MERDQNLCRVLDAGVVREPAAEADELEEMHSRDGPKLLPHLVRV